MSLTDDPEALVWLDSHDVGGLAEALDAGPGVRWVQLPSAGVELMTEVLDKTALTTLIGTRSFNMSEACVWRRS